MRVPRHPFVSLYTLAFLESLTLIFSNRVVAQANSAPQGFASLGGFDNDGNYSGVLSGSDTLVSIPFTRPPVFTGTVASISGNAVTVAGTPNWTANQFIYAGSGQPNNYYVVLGPVVGGGTNPDEGHIFPLSGNSGNALILNVGSDTISDVPANTQITIIPYWTLGTLFPAANAGTSFTASTSTRALQTQILIPNYNGSGINLSYLTTYYYISSGTNIGWRLFGDATTDHSNDTILPNGYFVVRNPGTAPTLQLLIAGNIFPGNQTNELQTRHGSGKSQDNAVSIIWPLDDVTLDDSGLSPDDGSFTATTSTRSIQDELFLYDNETAALNKSPSATYYYLKGGGWRLFGDSSTDHGGDIIPAGSAITIRKAPTSDGSPVFWTINQPAITN